MKYVVYLVALVLMISVMSCGKKGPDTVVVKVKAAWIPKNLGLANPPEKSGIYKDMLYYTEETPDKFLVHFTDESGAPKKEIVFKRGKGPGEVSFVMSMRVNNDKVYLYDVSQKVIITDIDGKYVDEVALTTEIGSFGALDIMDDMLYYHAMVGNKVSQVDLATGTLKNKVIWENPITDLNNLEGKEFTRGIVKADPFAKKFYIAYWNEPYRLEVYNAADLKLEKTLTRPLNESYEKMIFTNGGQGVAGNILVSSIDVDSKYIYASFGGGQKMTGSGQNVKVEGIPKKYYISVFDKATGEFTREITIENLDILTGVANIIGVTEKSIYLLVVDFGDSLKNIVKQDDKEKSDVQKQFGINYGIMIIENPMYDTAKK